MILSSLQMLVSWTAEGFYKDLLEFTIFLKQKKCLPNIHNQREKKKKTAGWVVSLKKMTAWFMFSHWCDTEYKWAKFDAPRTVKTYLWASSTVWEYMV